MNRLLRLEAVGLVLLSFYLFLGLAVPWWWFFVLLLLPDVSMIGYLFGPRVGAWTYNAAHHQAVAVLLFVLGTAGTAAWLQAAGLILLGHSALDRLFGYGLKYPDSFQHTHLGWIGRDRRDEAISSPN